VDRLKELFHKVRSVEASCQMNKEQVEDYDNLSKEYNKLSGSNTKYSICAKRNLLIVVESYIDAANS
jgi:hypothetical protein